MKTSIIILAASAVLLGGSGPNPNQPPIYGELTLAARFRDDPRVIDVRAGGRAEARRIAADCAGFVSDRPAFRLNYTAAGQPLIVSVSSTADTTLMINGPDNGWYCNDDGGEGTNPSLRFTQPQTGRYEIWVGTRTAGRADAARLHISEMVSQ
jgi:hypothetical protein